MNDKVVKMLVVGASLFLLLIGVCLYIIFDKQGYGTNHNSVFISYKIDDYIEVTPVIFNNYGDVYSDINVSKINIKNIAEDSTKSFFYKQNEFIGYISGYYDDIKSSIDVNYIPVSTANNTVKTKISGTILSVFYEMSFVLDNNYFDNDVRNYIVTTNIDLATEKVLTNDDLLSKYNYTKEYISEKIFEEDVLISKGQVVIDKNTNISLTSSDIERKKDDYVGRIISEFDNIINIYVEDHFLVLSYDKKELNNIFFDNDFETDIKFRYLK